MFKARGAFVPNGPSHLTSEITHVLYIPASSQFWAIKQTLRDKTFEKLDFLYAFSHSFILFGAVRLLQVLFSFQQHSEKVEITFSNC